MESQKRKRSANWNETEKVLLKQLVMGKIDIIENKDVSTNTNKMKKKAWQEILTSFNNMNDQPRDFPQLLAQWRNAKSVLKKKEFAYRRARNATGGGPPPPSPPAEDRAILESIPHEFEVDSNVFDSDGHQKSMVIDEEVTLGDSTIYIDDEMPSTRDSDPAATANIVSTPVSRPVPTQVQRAAKKIGSTNLRRNKLKMADDNYERKIFELAVEARKKEIKNAEEIHEMKKSILRIKKQYWELKLKNETDGI